MSAFMTCAAIVAAILFLTDLWLRQLEKKDMNGGLAEDHSRYTVFGIIRESIKERVKKHGKKEK